MKTKWRSPSNIALVKYWGKYPGQIPANPSLSFTLSACHTDTEVQLLEKQNTGRWEVEVFLAGETRPNFAPKITQLLEQIAPEASFLQNHRLRVDTVNSFPHSSGIASSASGMSALALGLLTLREEVTGQPENDFWRTASRWARLGSGSAARSVYGPLALWGRFAGEPRSSDEYALAYGEELHADFQDYCDYVLLVETGRKAVSSSAGHKLMQGHPFAERRFLQAHQNLDTLLGVMKAGDLEKFGEIVESEALTLHAMMMTSRPYFILMKPATLQLIEAIRSFRKDTGLPICFTLDAGANLHLLFPARVEQRVKDFVNSDLALHLKNEKYICDRVGPGPQKLE